MRNIILLTLVHILVLSACSVASEAFTPIATSTQTKTPEPTNTSTPTMTATPTITATPTQFLYENMNVYDSFVGDGVKVLSWKWHRGNDSPSNDNWIYTQDDGVLEIRTSEAIDGGGTQLFLSEASRKTKFRALGARVMISDKSKGVFGFAKIYILVKKDDKQIWTTQCFIAGWFDEKTGKFECQVADKNVKGIYSSESIPINIGQWYLVVIEIDKEARLIKYFLDNDLVATYEVPPDLIIMGEGETYSPAIGIWAAGQNDLVIAYYDEVRIRYNFDR